jgi:hypothetical protein
MSHRILKPDMAEPRGVIADISDLTAGYFYWAKNELCGALLGRRRAGVHHAIDDLENRWPEKRFADP